MQNETLVKAYNEVHNIRTPLSIVLSRVNAALEMLPAGSEAHTKLAKTLPSIQRMNEQISAAMALIKQVVPEEDLEHLV
ncbi:MAG: hypothetical protein HUJ89_02195 [Bacteroidales bacterium]|nr:hypothetical protein [Bacteroidales bacterium]